jgi:hypothetical protein
LRFFISFLLLITVHTVVAQQDSSVKSRIIYGKVLSENNEPIPYANVGLLNLRMGTSTNEVGLFLLRFEQGEYIHSDTLIISALGYKSFRKPMSGIADTLVVRLKDHKVNLNEIIITNLSAAEIVDEMFAHKRQNYPRKKFKVQAFFRGLIRNDSTYVKMTEAMLNISDKGYNKVSDTNIWLQELKSIDERDLDSLDIIYEELAEVNEAYRLWGLDFMNYSFNKIDYFLAPSAFNYALDSISYFDDKLVYCISAVNKSSNKSMRFYNRLFIEMESFALIESHRGWLVDNPDKKSTAKSLGSIGHSADGKHMRKEVVQYNYFQGKWYLSHISFTSSVIGGDKQKVKRLANEQARSTGSTELNYSGIKYDGRVLDPDKNNYFRHDEILITYVFDKSEKFARKQLMDRKKYVSRYNVLYDESFWNNQSQLLLNPNLKLAKEHLQNAEILNVK